MGQLTGQQRPWRHRRECEPWLSGSHFRSSRWGAEHKAVDMLATHPLRAVAVAGRAVHRVQRPEVKRQVDVFADRLMTTLSIRSGPLTELLPLPQHPFIRNQNQKCSSTCHCSRSKSDKLYELSGCRGSYIPVTSAGSLPMTMSLWNRLSNGRLFVGCKIRCVGCFLGHFLADCFLLSSSLARDRDVQRLDVKILPVCDTCQSVTVSRRTHGLDSEPGVAKVGAAQEDVEAAPGKFHRDPFVGYTNCGQPP
eukprot:Skav216779  [mRNA]  locus=scaffold579:97858:105575:+ [translate_table: standard]